jgi:hypothetical protein
MVRFGHFYYCELLTGGTIGEVELEHPLEVSP